MSENNDLSIIWNDLLRGTFGILNPLRNIVVSDLMKHCCKDLIEIEAKEVKSHTALR